MTELIGLIKSYFGPIKNFKHKKLVSGMGRKAISGESGLINKKRDRFGIVAVNQAVVVSSIIKARWGKPSEWVKTHE